MTKILEERFSDPKSNGLEKQKKQRNHIFSNLRKTTIKNCDLKHLGKKLPLLYSEMLEYFKQLRSTY